MPDDPRQEYPARDAPARPFPREAYIFGWLVICVVAAEGIHSLVTGVLGTGIILVALIPLMIWLMYVAPRRRGGKPPDR